jgi:hypothetical protein
MKSLHLRSFREFAGVFLLVGVLALPFFGFAKDDKIYVDDDASGKEDGSSSHPFDTISEALDEADSDTEVIVRPGTYKENITLPKGVVLTGADKDKVTIKGDDDDEPVVVMKHKTKLRGVTVKGGKVGVVVKEDSRAEVSDSSIEDNRREGIIVKKAPRNSDHKMSIVDTEVKDNGRAGIYSEKRKLVIIESEIKDNDGDGVNLARGVEAYFDNNSISKNNKSGLSFVLDDSSVFVASKNTFRENKREGIEINAFGSVGFVTIKKSRISENHHYGIAKLQRSVAASKHWRHVVIENNNNLFGNVKGNISPVISF